MNTFERLNEIINYIEDNLAGDIDYDAAAKIACCPKEQLQRFFSFMTEITLSGICEAPPPDCQRL